jgi:hypothetical protein
MLEGVPDLTGSKTLRAPPTPPPACIPAGRVHLAPALPLPPAQIPPIPPRTHPPTPLPPPARHQAAGLTEPRHIAPFRGPAPPRAAIRPPKAVSIPRHREAGPLPPPRHRRRPRPGSQRPPAASRPGSLRAGQAAAFRFGVPAAPPRAALSTASQHRRAQLSAPLPASLCLVRVPDRYPLASPPGPPPGPARRQGRGRAGPDGLDSGVLQVCWPGQARSHCSDRLTAAVAPRVAGAQAP